MPYKTAVGTTYRQRRVRDRARQGAWRSPTTTVSSSAGAKPPKRGKYRGFGISCMLEHAGGSPLEGTALSFPGGEHLRSRPQCAVDRPGPRHGVQPACWRSGSASSRSRSSTGTATPRMEIAGYASVGSRSAMTVSHALIKTVEAMLDQGQDDRRRRAGNGGSRHRISRRRFGVVGTDRRITCSISPARAKEMKKRGEIPEDLDTKANAETPLTFPNGCHIAEVEIDPKTGEMDARGLFGGRRLRQRAQHHDRRGPDPRLHRPGPGPGHDGATRSTTLRRAAGHRVVHGLRHAARQRHAGVQGRDPLPCRRRPIRSASRARARPAPPRRSPR